MNVPPIYIVGKGNLGWHLNELFLLNQFPNVHWISSRDKNSILQIPKESIVFLAVSDAVIESLIEANPFLKMVYCSGSLDLVSKYPDKLACWYPLYSFNKGILVDWSKIPVFTEVQNTELSILINQVNSQLQINAMHLGAMERKKLHLSAVFINNFTNACAIAAQEITQAPEIFGHLLPILTQTVEKISKHQGPLIQLQTGPAKRNDGVVIDAHLELLKTLVPEKRLYESISEYIQQKIK